ncbi:hypothetical protein Dimus_024970, partial [Dionaea muscipula]
FSIDLEQSDRREQLQKSGLGRSRPIFNKSTRFEDMRNVEERIPYRRPSVKKQSIKSSGLTTRDDDLDLCEFPSDKKSGQSKVRQLTIRPEAMPMDFVVRPQSKIDPDEVRARAKQTVQRQCRIQMNKKLQQLKSSKRKSLQATQVSMEGRGMVKLF